MRKVSALVSAMVLISLSPSAGHAQGVAGSAGDRANSMLEQQGEKLSIAVEDFNSALLSRTEAEQELEGARVDASAARAAYVESQEQVARRARETYLSPFSWIEPILESRGIGELMRAVVYVQQLLENDVDSAFEADRTRYAAEVKATDVERAVQVARDRATAAQEARDIASARMDEQRALLRSIDAEVNAVDDQQRALDDQQEQLESSPPIVVSPPRVTPEPSTAPRPTAPGPQPAPRPQPPSASTTPRPTNDAATPKPAPTPPQVTTAGPPKASASKAVATAAEQIGKPYQWAAAGPDSFDCSGLTMYAWKAAGVSLPHSSRSQFSSLPKVAKQDLKPGDLVFFGNPIHHVGIFEGGTTMIAAPQTGKNVMRQSINRSDYAGSARP